ncbi:alginate O-acetyltransferase AlgF [Pseudomonas sp. 7P_10.2_Bac1]|uniref:alginate O-acetyltransferase AlgF n=1 Tax=Pseudomonas sp. 7P_10.2_Bac1 TaxID=2971614 RepID=UPI0021C8267E|nr:alginate O-acetyltransferase AlgF [Pseudomonas sp. 7P_10.2_Bac1]MCU1727123.1 alginate O-acetyltransferase AlgF [Pseudomonas sp. 7P_10.2_Bac1]
MTRPSAELLALPVLAFSAWAQAAPALYSTGPAEDSAFIRFVNASTAPLDVIAQAGQPPLRLETAQPVSMLYPVDSSKPIKGALASGGQKLPIDLSIKPSEFVTVFAVPGGAGIQQAVVRESPDDFNALKASLAFFSVDASCADAALLVAGRNVELFKTVPVNTARRRMINPVQLSVQLVCAKANVGAPLDLGQLKAGERYSVMLVPSANGPRLLQATDTLSN